MSAPESAAAGAGSGDAPGGSVSPAIPAARPVSAGGERSPSPASAHPRPAFREVMQLRVLGPLHESLARIVAGMEGPQLVAEAEGYCREAVEHGGAR